MPRLSKNHVSKMTPRMFISVELSLSETPVKHKKMRFGRFIGPENGLVVRCRPVAGVPEWAGNDFFTEGATVQMGPYRSLSGSLRESRPHGPPIDSFWQGG